jgi:hypothetical protein
VLGLDEKAKAAANAGIKRIVLAAHSTSPDRTATNLHGLEPILCDTVEEAVRATDDWRIGAERYLERFRAPDRLPTLRIAPEVHRMNDPAEPGTSTDREGATTERDETLQQEFDGSRVRWFRELRKVRAAVIVGRPGSGKSVLCRWTLSRLAVRGLRTLSSKLVSTGRETLPVFLRMTELGKAASVEVAVTRSLPADTPDGFADALRENLFGRNVWFVLDGLDEVSDAAEREAALKHLNWLMTESASRGFRVILTTRRWRYVRPDAPGDARVEYDLAPLSRPQQRRFVKEWFEKTGERADRDRLLSQLRRNPSLAGIGRTPHTLTLACQTTGTAHQSRARAVRSRIYDGLVRGLLRGECWFRTCRGN